MSCCTTWCLIVVILLYLRWCSFCLMIWYFGWYVKIFVLVQVHSHFRFGHNIVNFIAAVVVSVVLFFKLDGKFSNLNRPCFDLSGFWALFKLNYFCLLFQKLFVMRKLILNCFISFFFLQLTIFIVYLMTFRNLTSL